MSSAEIKEYRLKILYRILPVISILLLIGLWLLASANSGNFPSPSEVLERTIRLFTKPVKKRNLILHVLASLRRIGIALLLAGSPSPEPFSPLCLTPCVPYLPWHGFR